LLNISAALVMTSIRGGGALRWRRSPGRALRLHYVLILLSAIFGGYDGSSRLAGGNDMTLSGSVCCRGVSYRQQLSETRGDIILAYLARVVL